jgi:hypothetical protein
MTKKKKKAPKGRKKKSPSTAKFSKKSHSPRVPYHQEIPVYDFIEDHDLDTEWGLAECLENLVFNIKEGDFLRWEAVVNDEQGLPLTRKQEQALDELISFSEDDGPILYINDIPRPSEPWYETVRKVVPKLIVHPFKTYEIYNETYHEGWSMLLECLENYAQDLSLPEGVTSPIDIIPPEIFHRLCLQCSFDALSGLGQEEELTLENESQKPWRVDQFIDDLRKFKGSVKYYDLSLENLFEFVELPAKDEKVLVESMKEKLGITTMSDKLFDVLKES